MEELIQDFLRVSASLYDHLTDIPQGEDRDGYIETIQVLLDNRGEIIEDLKLQGFEFNSSYQVHKILYDLDKGINERLNKVILSVKKDMKDLNNQKKNEMQYLNPYSHLQVMDGMYYDKKK